jgi:hypothetical protein
MDESSELPCPIVADLQIPNAKPISYWLKKFLACNPLYLGSAALLLLGIYQVSIDPQFLRGEIAQLGFNLGALQIYELLLVITALWLARGSLWYDAGLLVVLENILVLVPFILISQAALISQPIVWLLCIGAGAMAAARFACLKRFLNELNYPAGVLVIGTGVLAANVALPIVYRILHESKVGTHVTSGAAYHFNELAWSLLLPMLCVAVNLLPPPLDKGALGVQRRWVPLGSCSLWLAATVAHLYCLGYVYDFPLRPELIAPGLCIVMWTLRNRIHDLRLVVPEIWRQWLLIPPFLAGFLAAVHPESEYFLQVSILNAGLYGAICMCRRGNRLAAQLLWLSLVCVVAAWPREWMFGNSSGLTRGNCVGIALIGYLGCSFGFSRNPKTGLFAAIALVTVIQLTFSEFADIENWAIQSALVYFLVHSLKWDDSAHQGSRVLRIFAAGCWLLHSWCWPSFGAPHLAVLLFGVIVLTAWFAYRILNKSSRPIEIAIAALLVVVSSPGYTVGQHAQGLPSGLILVVASFLLFGLGTLLAVTRHRWHQSDSR